LQRQLPKRLPVGQLGHLEHASRQSVLVHDIDFGMTLDHSTNRFLR
jgi:hypothetical protein